MIIILKSTQNGSQNLVREYVNGAQYIDEVILVANGSTYSYYLSDLRYCVYGFVDSSGNVVERAKYDGYGKRNLLNAAYATISMQVVNQDYGYTGIRHDAESCLQYYRARYFDNTQGRFVNRDPIGYVDGLNLYRGYFVANSTDPYGFCGQPCPPYDVATKGCCNGIIYTLATDCCKDGVVTKKRNVAIKIQFNFDLPNGTKAEFDRVLKQCIDKEADKCVNVYSMWIRTTAKVPGDPPGKYGVKGGKIDGVINNVSNTLKDRGLSGQFILGRNLGWESNINQSQILETAQDENVTNGSLHGDVLAHEILFHGIGGLFDFPIPPPGFIDSKSGQIGANLSPKACKALVAGLGVAP